MVAFIPSHNTVSPLFEYTGRIIYPKYGHQPSLAMFYLTRSTVRNDAESCDLILEDNGG